MNSKDELYSNFLEEFDREYWIELSLLQVELLKLQESIIANRQRLLVIFEGRDTAGKGGAILRFTQHLRPRESRIVTFPKPTDRELGQWYFQRYVSQLPGPGEMVFFDRSYYNRAVVEPVMGFCTDEQYQLFMKWAVTFESMLVESGLRIVKFWYSIDSHEQQKRLEDRKANPLKSWKLSSVDALAQQNWERFTHYKETMFQNTSSELAPWVVIKGNDKKTARLESIRYLLSLYDYKGKGHEDLRLSPNDDIVKVLKSRDDSSH